MNQTGKIVFIVFIIAYIIFWGTIIYIGIPKEQHANKKMKHDERQRIEQGRACKYAYITLICYLLCDIFLEKIFDVVWCDHTFGVFLGIAFSLSVFLAYCVFQDAYFSINDSKVGTMISVNIIGLSQLFMGIEHIANGDIIQNGIITDNAINLLFFAVILLLDIFVFIRKRLDKQSA